MTAPVRIRLSRAKGWRKPEGAIVVSRPSRWGNPWKPGDPGRIDMLDIELTAPRALDRADCAHYFGAWLRGEWTLLPDRLTPLGVVSALREFDERREALLAALPAVRGRALCCWCPLDAPCHGDALLELANR